MRIAHIIMAHKGPEQLERLIRRMKHPMFDFYIHLDKKSDILPFKYLENLENVFFVSRRIECNWGGYSFVKAILCSVKEVIGSTEKYAFINLMSGQDYPLKPMDELYRFLKHRTGISFISYELVDNGWWKHAVTRFKFYHFTDYKMKGRYMLQKLANALMPYRKFPLNINLYGSSNSSWWILSTDAAEYLVNFIENNSKLNRFMQFTWGSDEFLIATVLMNSPFKDKIVNNNLRYIDWSEGGPHPKILSVHDLQPLLETDNFFARKFDIKVDAEILDLIDQYTEHPAKAGIT